MSAAQVAELRTIEPWSQEFGFRAFARKHGLTINHVYYTRRKLGLPAVYLPRHHASQAKATEVNAGGMSVLQAAQTAGL